MATNTYSGNPANSARDLLRFQIGDTGPTSWLLNDDEIAYAIANNTSRNRRMADCLEAIGNKLLQQPNFALDKWRENRHDVAKSFIDQADKLRKKSSAQGLYAGGISKAGKKAQEQDADRPAPWATINMDDNVPTPNELVSPD